MKLPMTKTLLIRMLETAHEERRLSAGVSWANSGGWSGTSTFTAGCAVGNFIHNLAPREDARFVNKKAEDIVWNIEKAHTAVGYSGNRVVSAISKRRYLTALSLCFEGSRDPGAGWGAYDMTLFLERVKKFFPARFSIDIDGIKPALGWDTCFRDPAKKTKKK